MNDFSDDEFQNREKQREKKEKAISELSQEGRERLEFFHGQKCKIPQNVVSNIINDVLPEGVKIQNSAVFLASHAARLFAAEIVETARSLSNKKEPLTPDLITIAYHQMMYQRKIPGLHSGMPLPNKRFA